MGGTFAVEFFAKYRNNQVTEKLNLLERDVGRQTQPVDIEELPLIVAKVFAKAHRPVDHLLRAPHGEWRLLHGVFQ